MPWWLCCFKRCLQKHLWVICSIVWTLGNRTYLSTDCPFKTLWGCELSIQCIVRSWMRHHKECHISLTITTNNLFMNLSLTDSSTQEDDSWTFNDLIIILVLIKKYCSIGLLELCRSFYSILYAWEKSTLGWAIIFQCKWQLLLSSILIIH